MNKLQVGDIVFVRPTGLVFKFIRWYTHDKYGHVGVIVGDLGGKTVLVEARRKGIDINAIDWYDKWNYDYSVYRLGKIDEYKKVKLRKEIMKYVSRKYDTFSLFNFIFKKDITEKNNEYFCSELIYTILTNLKILDNTTNPELVYPKKLRNLIEKQKYRIVKEVKNSG